MSFINSLGRTDSYQPIPEDPEEQAAGPSSQQEARIYQQSGRTGDAYREAPPSYTVAAHGRAPGYQEQLPDLSSQAHPPDYRSPKEQHLRGHLLRGAITGERGITKIKEKINKGGDPTSPSKKQGQNAFHKAALANSRSAVDVVDVLKENLSGEALYGALTARDKNGNRPVDLASDRHAKARNNSQEQTDLQKLSYRLEPGQHRPGQHN
jgi:hypothetical protein